MQQRYEWFGGTLPPERGGGLSQFFGCLRLIYCAPVYHHLTVEKMELLLEKNKTVVNANNLFV